LLGIAQPAVVPVELRVGPRVLPATPAAGARARVLRRAGVAVPRAAAGRAEAAGRGAPPRRRRLGGVAAASLWAGSQRGAEHRSVPRSPGVRQAVLGPVRRVRRGGGDL